MLRGALIPDQGVLTMEVQYQRDDEDEFVMVERVSDSLRVLQLDEDDWLDAQLSEKPAVSAEIPAEGKKDVEMPDTDGQARYRNLPAVPAPKLMQTPQNIPPLYPFRRINVYILISPEVPQGTIKSVILRGDSAEQPYELEIPIEVLPERSDIIHQLAAKNAIVELEEGRGWLVHTKDENGFSIKEKHSTNFQSMVEREAVRLGVQYQIAGKFTSFVATETVPEDPGRIVIHKAGIVEGAEPSHPTFHAQYNQSARATRAYNASYIPCSGAFSSSTSNAPASSVQLKSQSRALASRGLYSARSRRMTASSTPDAEEESDSESGSGERCGLASDSQVSSALSSKLPQDTKAEETDPLQRIIALQTFEGYWNLDARLLEIVGLSTQHKGPQDVNSKVWAVLLATTFLEGRLADDKESWVMVVEKARGWLKDVEEGEKGHLEEKWILAKQLIMGAD